MSYSELLRTIKRAGADTFEASKPAGLFYGEVTKEDPLEIKVEQKLLLKEEMLVLPEYLTDFEFEFTIDQKNDGDWKEPDLKKELKLKHFDSDTYGGSRTEEKDHQDVYGKRFRLTLHNKLLEGDKVILMRVQGGQKYLVLDRQKGGREHAT